MIRFQATMALFDLNSYVLRYRRESRLSAGQFDTCSSSLTEFAIHPHAVVVAEQDFETFVDIADADALLKQRREFLFGNTDAIVFNRDIQPVRLDPAPNADGAAVHLAAQSVPDAVFDDRLEQHARHQTVQAAGIDILDEPE